MPELSDRDAISLMLEYYGQTLPAKDTARMVALISKADTVRLVQFAFEQGVQNANKTKGGK